MILGLQLGLLKASDFEEAVEQFLCLQRDFPLQAGEIHLETSLYPPSCRPWEDRLDIIADLRRNVKILGVHLPFMEINPLSPNPRIRSLSRELMAESLQFAAQCRADYAVFHARSPLPDIFHAGNILSAWQRFSLELAAIAQQQRVLLCLENADDIRMPSELEQLIAGHETLLRLCLDIGHLFERVYPARRLHRIALQLNDRYSPWPFLISHGLPAGKAGNWLSVLETFKDKLAVIHVHNHDGCKAHQGIKQGKINLGLLRQARPWLQGIPLIVEVDYGRQTSRAVREDLRQIQEICYEEICDGGNMS